MFRITALILSLFVAVASQAQSQQAKEAMKGHVYVLASDFMEGRLTGSQGEALALQYISSAFEFMGIPAVSNDGFAQPFAFSLGKEVVGRPLVLVDENTLQIKEDYEPMPFSGSGEVVGKGYRIETKKQLQNLPAFTKPVIFEVDNTVFLDGPAHPHATIDYKAAVNALKSKGASAILFYTTENMLPKPPTDLNRKVEGLGIPVLYLTEKPQKEASSYKIDLTLKTLEVEGHNAVAMIDNQAENTVVFGAHYDHLGHGEYGGSLYRGDKPAIHNGADDNASGVALMLELARWALNDGPKNQNYLFIAFSGEELGLFGSSYFTKNPLIPMESVRFMLNFDMVGSLDTATRNLALNGVGTSPSFQTSIDNIPDLGLNIKTSSSGIGPSDHTSFYLKDIPVLHFFTGTTPHYHRPTDDPHRINYEGLGNILEYTKALVTDLAKREEIAFTKTKDADSRKAPKFSVTLGVVPDYMFSGSGMKIDGITEGKPASQAGLNAGDIVVKMGEVDVTDMMSYMKGLSQFKPGDKTTVTVVRSSSKKEFTVTF